MMGFPKAGYVIGCFGVLLGSLLLFLVSVHKKNLRHKHKRANGSHHLCIGADCPLARKLSFTQEPDNEPAVSFGHGCNALLLNSDLLVNQLSEEFAIEANVNGDLDSTMAIAGVGNAIEKPELTCISEEGIADMDTTTENNCGGCVTPNNKGGHYSMENQLKNDFKVSTAEPPVPQGAELFKKMTMSTNPDAIQNAADVCFDKE